MVAILNPSIEVRPCIASDNSNDPSNIFQHDNSSTSCVTNMTLRRRALKFNMVDGGQVEFEGHNEDTT